MLDLASRPIDPEKPTYHVMPKHGWVNDPNSPLWYNGQYHLFYQHIVNGCEWDFGIVWGHAVSSDLVHWEHMPPALIPTPGGADADGCFSGCGVVDTNGVPTILYTGVRLRSNPDCGPLPPPDCDLNLPFIETQLIATPDGDPGLAGWAKQELPMLAMPPSNMPLVGWRDPFIFEFKGQEGRQEWGMLMGSGLKGSGGAIMIYRSAELTTGWRYEGMLCEASNIDTGAMWECPLLLELQVASAKPLRASLSGSALSGLHTIQDAHTELNGSPAGAAPASKAAFKQARTQGGQTDKEVELDPANQPQRQSSLSEGPPQRGTSSLLARQLSGGLSGSGGLSRELSLTAAASPLRPYTHFLCISPDAPTNPVLYWLGHFDSKRTRFLLEGAKGPLKLDLGNVLYAPNLLTDGQGRHLLWGWLQERRKVGSYDYAGCMTVPRQLLLRDNRLIQVPVPEVATLRRGDSWRAQHLTIFPEESTPLEGVTGSALDIEVTLERGGAAAAGLLFRSWKAGGEGSAAIVFDWERCYLEAIFEGQPGQDTANGDSGDDGVVRTGGPVELKAGEPVSMRLLVDHSCVECYLGSGEVLSTRIYRGDPPPGADAGIDFVTYGGHAHVERWEAWHMRTIWRREGKAQPFGTIYEPITSVMPMGSPP